MEAVPFYEKLGFKEAGRIAVDLSRLSDHGNVGIYKEAGCIYMPRGKSISKDDDQLSSPCQTS
jgi:hypothetical protein